MATTIPLMKTSIQHFALKSEIKLLIFYFPELQLVFRGLLGFFFFFFFDSVLTVLFDIVKLLEIEKKQQ